MASLSRGQRVAFIRMPQSLHKQLADEAHHHRTSLTALVVAALETLECRIVMPGKRGKAIREETRAAIRHSMSLQVSATEKAMRSQTNAVATLRRDNKRLAEQLRVVQRLVKQYEREARVVRERPKKPDVNVTMREPVAVLEEYGLKQRHLNVLDQRGWRTVRDVFAHIALGTLSAQLTALPDVGDETVKAIEKAALAWRDARFGGLNRKAAR